MSSCAALEKIAIQSIMSGSSLSDSLAATEDSLRSEQQHQDQHDQRADVLHVGRQPQRRQLDEEADDEGAHECAERGAQAAEGDRGEDEEEDLEAHVPADAGTEVRPEDA